MCARKNELLSRLEYLKKHIDLIEQTNKIIKKEYRSKERKDRLKKFQKHYLDKLNATATVESLGSKEICSFAFSGKKYSLMKKDDKYYVSLFADGKILSFSHLKYFPNDYLALTSCLFAEKMYPIDCVDYSFFYTMHNSLVGTVSEERTLSS